MTTMGVVSAARLDWMESDEGGRGEDGRDRMEARADEG